MLKTDPVVVRFMEAVYPGAGALALASFDEVKTLTDAAEELEQLRAALKRLVNRDLTYVYGSVHIHFDSHPEALRAIKEARELVS